MHREHWTFIESFINLNSLPTSRFTLTDHLRAWLFPRPISPFLLSLPGCSTALFNLWVVGLKTVCFSLSSSVPALGGTVTCNLDHSNPSLRDLVCQQRYHSRLRTSWSGVIKRKACLAATSFITSLGKDFYKMRLPWCKNLVYPHFSTTSSTVLEPDG